MSLRTSWRDHLVFFLNGQRKVLHNPDPARTLLEYLREDARLTGTKLGCGEGGCGACTVTLTREEHVDGQPRIAHRAVNACMAPLCVVDGCHVTTVEGIGTINDPHPAQERIAKLHGSQCGFCTPGFVMSLYTSLQENPKPKLDDIEDVFAGNLCRCTGYRPLMDAAKTFCDGSKCATCPNKASCDDKKRTVIKTTTKSKLEAPLPHETFEVPEDKIQRIPAFPEELAKVRLDGLAIKGDVEWYRPPTVPALLNLKKELGNFGKIVAGNTEIRIETKMKHIDYPKLISTAAIPSLSNITVAEDGAVAIGGSATLSALEHVVKTKGAALPHHVSKVHGCINRMLHWFASPQIRNMGTVAGNVVTGCSIADLNPILTVANAVLTLEAEGAEPKKVPIRDFFVSYRKTAIKPEEVLTRIDVPGTKANEIVQCYKQARRRDDDISLVCGAFRAVVDDKKKILEFDSAIGGMGPVTTTAPEIAATLIGQTVPSDPNAIVLLARSAVDKAFDMHKDVPGGMPAYRPTVTVGFLSKFLAEVSGDANLVEMTESYMTRKNPTSSGEQTFVVDANGGGLQHSMSGGEGFRSHQPSSDKERGAVGEPLPHNSAMLQATGQAKYVDDMPSPQGTLHCALVLSEKAVGNIDSIDATAALALPDVVAYYDAKDLTEQQNMIGGVVMDEELFRRSTVTSQGQVLGLIVAESHEGALRAARKVKVAYSDNGEKPAITIQQSVAAQKENAVHHNVTDGRPEEALASAEVVVEGTIRIGGQEHFYLETNAALVVPTEAGELDVYSSSQAVNMTQKFAARACGLPYHRVTAHVKRMGGGFGGKESRTAFISSVIALAAHKLQRPCRINVERQQDMMITGTRHPFSATYKVGATKEGKLVGAVIDVYNNAGYSADLSESVMDRALFHITNAYKLPNISVTGHICHTNTVTNTAFRGFGGPQGMMVCEAYMEHLAKELNMPVDDVRAKNFIPEGGRTHYGQQVVNNNVQRLWKEIHDPERGDLVARQKAVDDFNSKHKWKKRGLATVPVMFGINFTAKFLNQAGALVHVYQDGTILVSHGGTEMGQGLHMKCIQIAAKAFGVPASKVFISESASDKVPNASPTAASVGSDIYGMAVLDACEQITKRLEPYWEKVCPDGNRDASKFPGVAWSAYFDRVNLSAQGFYSTPGGGYDWGMKVDNANGACNSIRGEPFNYFTFGVAASETEIDVLTGDMRVQRADIVMDVGNSLNPAIDIGQIEGAYVQGLGWCMLEDLVWGGDENSWLPPGACFTRGPGVYKIPSSNDVPVDMRVSLLADAPNPRAVHSSKAVGEPPLFCSSSAFFATRNAIAAARKEFGKDGHFTTDSPLTPERIRMACGDPTAEQYAAKIVKEGGPAHPALFC